MPLTFPLAETARAALESSSVARTVGEARDKAGAPVSLVSEWLRPSAADREALQGQIDAGITAGFVQVYEDSQGQPVFAVAFWKRGIAPPAPPLPHRETAPDMAAKPAASGDTVDDLYFERGRTSRRAGRGRGGRSDDPNQMDLFAGKSPATPDAGKPTAAISGQDGQAEAPRPPKAKVTRKPKPGAKP